MSIHASQLIDDLAYQCHATAKLKGFWTVSENTPEKIMLVVTELAEFVESYRKGDEIIMDEHCPEFMNTEIELADAVIRIFDIAKYHNFQIGKAIVAKMKYNETRPHLHGKKF